MSASVVLWDDAAEPDASAGETWHWRRYSCTRDSDTSVPQHLEQNAERFRSTYLAFIHDLGEARVDGRRLIDALERHPGLSFWWMTHLAEKSPFKSPRIYACLRVLALEELLRERAPSRLTLVSADRVLAKVVATLCGTLGVPFAWSRTKDTTPLLRRCYERVPFVLRGALMLLRYVASRWRLRRGGIPAWFGKDGSSVLMISYFVHLDAERCAAGTFASRQWEGLPSLLAESGNGQRTHLNWIHHFLFNSAVPDVRTGLDRVARFNRDSERQGLHAFLDSYWSPALFWRVVRDWLWLSWRSWRLSGVRKRFTPKGSAVNLWPLLESDWGTSTSGPIGVLNCFWAAAFDVALAEMPRQSRGYYLYEGQGWERALLHFWRVHEHGEITGVQHATAPFWHLYYFDDARTWRQGGRCPMPLPDRVAVNGPASHRALEDAGFPPERLVAVEALRYLRLGRPSAPRTEARRLEILILGDMIPSATRAFLRVIEEAVPTLPADTRLTFKPHPGFVPRMSEFPGLVATVTEAALAEILPQFDVALAANSTSAACDAYTAGRTVAVMLDGNTLNLSPLRGHAGVLFFATAAELGDGIMKARAPTSRVRTDLFHLDPQLPRWRQALAASARGPLHSPNHS